MPRFLVSNADLFASLKTNKQACEVFNNYLMHKFELFHQKFKMIELLENKWQLYKSRLRKKCFRKNSFSLSNYRIYGLGCENTRKPYFWIRSVSFWDVENIQKGGSSCLRAGAWDDYANLAKIHRQWWLFVRIYSVIKTLILAGSNLSLCLSASIFRSLYLKYPPWTHIFHWLR